MVEAQRDSVELSDFWTKVTFSCWFYLKFLHLLYNTDINTKQHMYKGEKIFNKPGVAGAVLPVMCQLSHVKKIVLKIYLKINK